MTNPILGLIANNRLTPDEVIVLFKELKTKTTEREINQLKDKILLGNLGLVISGCKKYFKYTNIENEDLIQEGIVGLRIAIDKFDVNRGTKFSTCAYWWIKQRVRRYLEEQTMDVVRSNSTSIDNTFTDDADSKTLSEMLIANSNMNCSEEIKVIKHIANKVLNTRERLILNLRYGI